MRPRKGFAMLAAIWLLVAIAVVSLEFALDARERAQIGLDAMERGKSRAAAIGALAMMQAQLERALTLNTSGSNAQALRGADPWLGVDSLYSGQMPVDSVLVDVVATDLGTQLNINSLSEVQLRTMFNFVLRDASTANTLAQSILDWRDVDSLPRPAGAERDYYIKNQQLALPTNAPFRELEEILQVNGMTPEIYQQILPYLTTHGSGLINLNTADTVVLRVLPGMTDQIIARIFSMRSGGRRITSVGQVMPQQAQPGGRGGQQPAPTQTALESAATVTTNEVELSLTAYAGPQALPVRLRAIVQRSGTTI